MPMYDFNTLDTEGRFPGKIVGLAWRYQSRTLRRIMALAIVASVGPLLVGCSESPPPHVPAEVQLHVGMPAGGNDTGDLSLSRAEVRVPTKPTRLNPFSVQAANARLASFDKNGPSRERMKWGLSQLSHHLDPPSTTTLVPGETTLVQLTQRPVPQQPIPQQPIAQQPIAQQPLPVELIPTPKGEPDPGFKKVMPKQDGAPDSPNNVPPGPDELMAKNLDAVPNAKAVIPPGNAAMNLNPAVPGEGFAPDSYKNWAAPDVTLFVTGQQNGYIEPCGCTGLDKQKGGIARRNTFIKQLREMGWELVPIDAGNQVRRVGQQALIKLASSDKALTQMQYQMVGFGPDDMRLPGDELLVVAGALDGPETARYISANVVLYDRSYVPQHKVVRRGRINIGMTTILDPKAMTGPVGSDIEVNDPVESAKNALAAMNQDGATFRVITFYGKEEDAEKLMQAVPGYDLIVAAGGYGEPTYQPQPIKDSSTKLIVTGNKGMYAGLVGLYDKKPFKYARVALTHEFKDDPEMRLLMGEYQKELERLGLSRLKLDPIPHPSGEKYVGTAACGQCHESALDVWKDSPHAHATVSIVSPPEDRGDVPRHFDPECLSCHVTGWNPQGYYPYETGYVALEPSRHLHGSGCENCHGPGAGHAAAERDDSGASDEEKARLRKAMQLPYEKAKEHCMKCHDLDNSPDFHQPNAFEDEYWPQVEH